MSGFWRRKGSTKYSAVDYDGSTVQHGSDDLYRPGWKATIGLGAWVLALCLAANVALVIWAFTGNHGPTANAFNYGIPVYMGDCNRATTISTASHLAINLVSTLILAAGTACMQVLSSPTREEIDVAHRSGRWFNIGLLSSRNLLGIKRVRLALYLILAGSSVPIHFFYNSILYSTLGTNDSLAIATTRNFVNGSALDEQRISSLASARQAIFPKWDYGNVTGYNIWTDLPTRAPSYPSNEAFISAVSQLKPENPNARFQNITWRECLRRFNNTPYESIQNVAIVTSLASDGPDILDLSLTLTPGKSDWTCNPVNGVFNDTDTFLGKCAIPVNGTRPAAPGFGNPTQDTWNVQYCLISEPEGHCQITFSPTLMMPVIAMNAVKLLVLLYTLLVLDYRPLVTAGDAVASFMRNPDPTTAGVGPHSTQSVVKSAMVDNVISSFWDKKQKKKERKWSLSNLIPWWQRRSARRYEKAFNTLSEQHEKLMHRHVWTGERKRWASAVSRARWVVTLLPWTVLTLTTTVYAATASPNVRESDHQVTQDAWSQGLGEVSPGFISRTFIHDNLASIVVTGNLPQLAVSVLWIFYTSLITSMLIASEMCDFTREAKGMRVSPPVRGVQRSTYFLQIPYRYSLLMTAAVVVLHWLTSQSLFLVRISQYDITGKLTDGQLLSSLGYSIRGIAGAAATCGLITLAPVFLSLRRFPSGIPVLAYNSLALSIACHPGPHEPPEPQIRRVRYGMINVSEDHGVERYRLGFSAAHDVKPIEPGIEYEASKCLSAVLAPGLAGASEGVKENLNCTLASIPEFSDHADAEANFMRKV